MSKLLPGCRIVLLTVLLASVVYSIFHTLAGWPKGDEADYLYQARLIAEGKIPYRDFHAIIPPLGQLLTAGVIQLFGVNLPVIRSMITLGWVLQLILLYRFVRCALPVSWAILLIAFLWLSDSRYLVNQHHFWSGLFALMSILQLNHYWQTNTRRHLVWGGVWMGLVLCTTQSLGGLMIFTTLAFSWAVDRKQWLKTWGVSYCLPMVIMPALIGAWLYMTGAWPSFWHDAVLWVFEGHYAQTTTIGYFPTLLSELRVTLLPLLAPAAQSLPWYWRLLFLLRIPVALHLILMALLPLLGILSATLLYLNSRETKQKQSWAWLTLMGIVLVVSTLSYGTSMHLVSNSGLVVALAWIGLYQYFKEKHYLLKWLLCSGWVLMFFLQMAAIFGSWMQLTMGVWLPPTPTITTATLLPESEPMAVGLLKTLQLADFVSKKHEPVLVLYESPDLYLATTVQNPTRYSIILPVYTSQQQLSEIISALQQHPPAVIIDDNSIKALAHDPRFSHLSELDLSIPALRNFIKQYYRYQFSFGEYLIYFKDEAFEGRK